MRRISRRGVRGGLSADAARIGVKTALGSQAASSASLGTIGTGGRGRYVGGIFARDPRARIAALCDIHPERIDLAKNRNLASRSGPRLQGLPRAALSLPS